MDIVYQIIGIIALCFSVVSFQAKRLKIILIHQCMASVFWSVHFYLGGAYAGCIMNVLCIARTLGFAFIENKKGRLIFNIGISTCFVGVAILTVLVFNELWFIALVTAVASVVGNTMMTLNNEKNYRLVQLFFISPCWLFNNIWYLSIGGIICESLSMISIIIAIIRYRKKKSQEANS